MRNPNQKEHRKDDPTRYSKFIFTCMLYLVYKNPDAVLNRNDKDFFLSEFPAQGTIPERESLRRLLNSLGNTQYAKKYFIKTSFNGTTCHVLKEEIKIWLRTHSTSNFLEFLAFMPEGTREKKALKRTWDIYQTTIEDIVSKRARVYNYNTLTDELHEVAEALLLLKGKHTFFFKGLPNNNLVNPKDNIPKL